MFYLTLIVFVCAENGATALFKAASQNRVETLKTLLNFSSLKVDFQGRGGRVALMASAQNGHVEACRVLLTANARVDARDENGLTALMLAAQSGHTDVVSLLLSARANVHASNTSGWSTHSGLGFTALLLAAENGHTPAVSLLLRGEAQIDAKNSNGWTALMLAATNGYPETVTELLRKKATVDTRNNRLFTPLMKAAENGHTEIAALLIREKAEVDAVNKHRYTALMKAAVNGHADMTCLLLQEHADVHGKNVNGFTPLLLAAENGHPEIVALLLREGADVDVQDNFGFTSLMRASENGYTSVVGLLLYAGAAVNAIHTTGWTSLMLAARFGHTETCALLLHRGADSTPVVTVKEGIEMSAAGIAGSNGHTALEALLRQLSQPSSPPSPPPPRKRVDWREAQIASWSPLAELLGEGAVVLWPLPVLRLLWKNKFPVQRRQDLETVLGDLGWEAEKIQEAKNEAAECARANFPLLGGFTVVCLSYSWLSKDHPDPSSLHLRLLIEELNRQWWAEGERGKRVFVFWDFISLHQRPRSDQEEPLFQKALSQLDTLYSSIHTRVVRSAGVPPDSINPIPYDQRGWPCFEKCVTGFKPSRLVLQLPLTLPERDQAGKQQASFETQIDYVSPSSKTASETPDGNADRDTVKPTTAFGLSRQQILPPLAPEEFGLLLHSKKFTNGADAEMVKILYRQFVHRTASSVRRVSFASRSCFSDEDAVCLSRLFKYLLNVSKEKETNEEGVILSVEQVDLSGTSVTDRGAVQLVETLALVEGLRELNFGRTEISVGTLSALLQSIQAGGLPSLVRIVFIHCKILSQEIRDEDASLILDLAKEVEGRGRTMVLNLQFSTEGLSANVRSQVRREVKRFLPAVSVRL
uniref:Uncharacterized protein n=1 Tax=Chromera velia CCMP2878 TaxID=1169474 RepID=A0A0G4HUI1_9ALVE|eukprot:Cvel_31867.t1-p1 / transcript=Cvel_31867.t1 / gene=Cvel_31867 / organism=Chromera_velia_CCMP2878 / gene_product=Ankyrin repeat and KH domain-containing protein, putative / transcript_product=Ankyrin repeat and KH domain-containing protein, putative / location=Cvel_scaffold4830:4076-6691(+) / protein_length=872 / sequence_SO=supercontig / SO=protein_coding / is_pseudo=false